MARAIVNTIGDEFTDWVSDGVGIWTGTSVNPTKATTTLEDEVRWRRVGSDMEVSAQYRFSDDTGVASGTGSYLLEIPAGYVIDTSKIDVNTVIDNNGTFLGESCGVFAVGQPNSSQQMGNVSPYDTTHVRFRAHSTQLASNGAGGASVGNDFGSTSSPAFHSTEVYFTCRFTVPIVGWDN